jgi:hypothetical protein
MVAGDVRRRRQQDATVQRAAMENGLFGELPSEVLKSA